MEYGYARKLSLTRIIVFNVWIALVTLLCLCFFDDADGQRWDVQLGFTIVILMPILVFDLSQVGAYWLVWRYKIPMQQAVAAKDLLIKNEEAQLTTKPFWLVFLSGFVVSIVIISIFRYWLPAYQKLLGFLFQELIVTLWLINCFFINKHFWIKKQLHNKKMKKIFVLYTGGTIGMVQSEHGLHPDTELMHTALKPFSGSLIFDWHVCQPLIDSSAVTPCDWANWLDVLQQKLPHYDGVLVLHGTDTLAYTANILTLCLNTQGKPIILTGSQKPFSHPQSDAPANLQTAVVALQNESIQQVMLAFYGKLLPAIGSSKASTEIDDGFSNAHFGFRLPGNCDIRFSGSLKAFANEKRQFSSKIRVATLFLTPAQSLSDVAKSWANTEFDALIVQTYGHGNSPGDEKFLLWIQSLIQQGKRVLNISQVPQGCTAAVYAQGSALRQAGVVNGGKCNIETATALMMLACTNDWTTVQLESELKYWQLID